MDNSNYVALSRQAGLIRQFNALANNIANADTGGYRREDVVFAEHVKALDAGDPSLSIATASRRIIDFAPGDIQSTGNPFDVAIEGDGFFLVEGADGPRLTRAGAFSLNGEGELVTADARRVLDEGGAPIVIPPQADTFSIAADGTIAADGQPVGRLGLVTADPASLIREGDNVFRAEQGYEPAPDARVRQFAREGSNVSAVTEIARLIEVQRAYEAGQRFLESEDERIKRVVREIGLSR